ncbi:hypothetical protein QAD02_019392 [Eretmocerus hayati]|uniref:Uncharacterized protein n=1 Tax=Eretmocerus hayati TaxID=131215 RepID=A0ACC2PJJ5_9HYME|nr:hypothetical protein QAD02_019392 [Eretmocerus hayati]
MDSYEIKSSSRVRKHCLKDKVAKRRRTEVSYSLSDHVSTDYSEHSSSDEDEKEQAAHYLSDHRNAVAISNSPQSSEDNVSRAHSSDHESMLNEEQIALDQTAQVEKELEAVYVIKDNEVVVARFKQQYFPNALPNNSALFNDESIFKIVRMTRVSRMFCAKVMDYGLGKSLYEVPCDSMLLNIHEIDDKLVSRDIRDITLQDISIKLRIPNPEPPREREDEDYIDHLESVKGLNTVCKICGEAIHDRHYVCLRQQAKYGAIIKDASQT